MSTPTLSPEDIQALTEITDLHIRSGIPRTWDEWVGTCADDVMLLPPGEARTVGREAARSYLDTFPTTLSFAGEATVIRGIGDLAYTSGHCRGVFEIEGKATDIAIKWLAIYERQADGQWKMLADMWNEDPM